MNQGLDRPTAANLVDRNVRAEMTDAGTIRFIDEVNRTAYEIPVEQMETQQAGETIESKAQPGYTLYDQAVHATGPGSALAAVAAVPLAMMGLPYSKRTVMARQSMRTEVQNLIRALAINPRFPVGEQERIREEVNLLPGILDDPELMRSRMESLDSSLRRRMESARTDANDTGLPEDTRSSQKSNAQAIENFLDVLGVPKLPEGVPEGSVKLERKTKDGYDIWLTPTGQKLVDQDTPSGD